MIIAMVLLALLLLGGVPLLCRAPRRPLRSPGRDLPLARAVWLELADTEPYDPVAWDRKIDAMLATTARWQQAQEQEEREVMRGTP